MTLADWMLAFSALAALCAAGIIYTLTNEGRHDE